MTWSSLPYVNEGPTESLGLSKSHTLPGQAARAAPFAPISTKRRKIEMRLELEKIFMTHINHARQVYSPVIESQHQLPSFPKTLQHSRYLVKGMYLLLLPPLTNNPRTPFQAALHTWTTE
jgi:hypothetical protein